MKPCWKSVTETKMVSKCVDRGHWECREEYSHFKALCNSLSSLCSSGCNTCNTCSSPCGDPCATACCTPCQPSNCVTRKVWCPNMVQEQCPVTCCRRVCEMVPTTVKVQTCRTEVREEKCKVCVTKCIPESRVEKYTVCVQRSVPCEATRTVCVRIPCEEMVTCTRMVSKQVMKEVPCCQPTTTCCPTTTCSSPCNTCSTGHGLFGGCGSLFSGWQPLRQPRLQ